MAIQKKIVIFQCIFDKSNQNEIKKHKFLEKRLPFTKTHFQDPLFRIKRPDVFLTGMTGDSLILLKCIFQRHMLIIRKR